MPLSNKPLKTHSGTLQSVLHALLITALQQADWAARSDGDMQRSRLQAGPMGSRDIEMGRRNMQALRCRLSLLLQFSFYQDRASYFGDIKRWSNARVTAPQKRCCCGRQRFLLRAGGFGEWLRSQDTGNAAHLGPSGCRPALSAGIPAQTLLRRCLCRFPSRSKQWLKPFKFRNRRTLATGSIHRAVFQWHIAALEIVPLAGAKRVSLGAETPSSWKANVVDLISKTSEYAGFARNVGVAFWGGSLSHAHHTTP